MYRDAMEELHRWKQKKNKKPLVIRGARQVGKTWIMKKFGETAYINTVYINFDNNQQMKELFEKKKLISFNDEEVEYLWDILLQGL